MATLPARITGHRLVVLRARKEARAVLERESAKGYAKGWRLLRAKLPTVAQKVRKGQDYGELLDPTVLRAIERAVEDGLESGAKQAAAILATGESEWFANAGHEFTWQSDEVYARYLKNFEANVPGGFKNVSQTVSDAIHREVMDWAGDPANPGQQALETSLSQWFAPYRSQLIATTEGTRLCTAEQQLVGETLGSTQGEFDTSNDSAVCSECIAAAEGNPYTIDGTEPQPPLHPGDRCEWVVIPAGMEDEANPPEGGE